MIKIQLTRGTVALIDDADADLCQHSWYCDDKGYARRREKGTRRALCMHRIILERIVGRPLHKSEETDHINWNKLDNRRSNLRIANRRQNNHNRGLQSNNRSGYIGVSRKAGRITHPWQAYIGICGRRKFLGSFDTPEEAAKAYNEAAQWTRNQFVVLNEV